MRERCAMSTFGFPEASREGERIICDDIRSRGVCSRDQRALESLTALLSEHGF